MKPSFDARAGAGGVLALLLVLCAPARAEAHVREAEDSRQGLPHAEASTPEAQDSRLGQNAVVVIYTYRLTLGNPHVASGSPRLVCGLASESCHWVSKDPLGLARGLNLYEYSYNDPVNYIDGTGRTPESVADMQSIGDTAADRAAWNSGVGWAAALGSALHGIGGAWGWLMGGSATAATVGTTAAAVTAPEAAAGGACASGAAAAINRARAACPGGDWIRLSQYMQADVGEDSYLLRRAQARDRPSRRFSGCQTCRGTDIRGC